MFQKIRMFLFVVVLCFMYCKYYFVVLRFQNLLYFENLGIFPVSINTHFLLVRCGENPRGVGTMT